MDEHRAQEPNELAEDTWSEYLAELSQGCVGAGTSVRITNDGQRRPGAAGTLSWPLQAIRYDRRRREIEVAVGDSASQPALRCFIHQVRRVFEADPLTGHAILVVDRDGIGTLIEIRMAALRTQTAARVKGAVSGCGAGRERRLRQLVG